MTEEKSPMESLKELNNLWTKYSKEILICMGVLLIYVMGASDLTKCNTYYQEKLLNNTFLQEMIEYNNHRELYTNNEYDFAVITDLPQHLNNISTNNLIVGEKTK